MLLSVVGLILGAAHHARAGQTYNDPESRLLTYFLREASDRRTARRSEDFATTDVAVIKVSNALTRRLIQPDFDHTTNDSVESLGKRIAIVVQEVVRQECPSANPLLRERLLLQGAYDWVRTHFRYNRGMTTDPVVMDMEGGRLIREKYWVPESLMRMDQPACVCAGFANTTEAIGRSMGLDCFTVNGDVRGDLNSGHSPEDPTKATGHKWVVLRQKDGFLQPFDASRGAVNLSAARSATQGLFLPAMSPLRPLDWALHLAIYRATVLSSTYKLLSDGEAMTALPYSDWRSTDISILRRSYRTTADNPLYETAVVNWSVR